MLTRSHATILAVLVSLFVALGARPARAQCGPDGLDAGNCCTPASVLLPAFPPISQNIRFICFDSCATVVNAGYCVSIGAPVPLLMSGAVVCGVYRIPFQIRICGTNTLLWSGSITAHYSRNWQEFAPPVGTPPITVWRFILNGDMAPSTAVSTSPNFRPACNPTHPRVYFMGYIDYARDCNTNTWTAAWALDHGCDGVHHQAGTARPAPGTGFHPTRSFNFVGPGAGFIVGPSGAAVSDGPIFAQSTRYNNWPARPAICTFREPTQGTFQALAPGFCQCSGGAVSQYVPSIVNSNGVCGSQTSPSAVGPFLQKKIGRWSNPNVFPGNEALRFDFGYLNHRSACSPIAPTSEWFEGVETLRGFATASFTGIALGAEFEDLGSSNLSVTSPAVYIGAPHVTYHILNYNLQ